jgi:hypothetical protein
MRLCDKKLVEASIRIQERDPWKDGEVCFMPRELIMTTLPHRKVAGSEYTRVNGNHTLSILTPADIGIPWGSTPRLIICWLTTEAKKTGNREIKLGKSFNNFMQQAGLGSSTGGTNGSLKRIRKHTQQLFSSTVSFHSRSKEKTSEHGYRFADSHTIWWEEKIPESQPSIEVVVLLSEAFFNEAVKNAVPLDLTAVRTLKQSPLALDIYCWLTHRYFRMKRPAKIPWSSISEQFGASYSELRQLRRYFLQKLKAVSFIYPNARYKITSDHLILYPSKTHVPVKRNPQKWLEETDRFFVNKP